MNLPLFNFDLPWLADVSLRLGVLLAAFLTTRPLLRRLVGSVWLSTLWLILLARLLVPWPLATPFGMSSSTATNAPLVESKSLSYEVRTRVLEGGLEIAQPTIAPANKITVSGWREVWLAGLALGLSVLFVRFVHTGVLARKTKPACDLRLLAVFEELPVEWRRGITLRETDALSVPTLAGLMRPAIWMPRAWLAQLSDMELRHVLLHELGHARRRDLLVQWLFSFAVCVHWFNPLVWLAARCARADREMACDAWVLARSQNVAPDEYGATLLKTIMLLREPLRLAPHVLAMAASKRGLFTRIATLGQFRARPAWRGVVGLFALCAALAFLTTTRLRAQAVAIPSAPGGPVSGGTPALLDDVQATANDTIIPLKALAAEPKPTPKAGLPQIEIAAHFIEVTDSAVLTLRRTNEIFGSLFGGQLPASSGLTSVVSPNDVKRALHTLGQVRGADLLTAPRVTTRSGQRAVIEIIREFRYPIEFDPDDQKPPQFTPTSFETRNIGVTLEVEPTVGADGQTIDLQLIPQVVELTSFNRIGPGGSTTVVKVPSGKEADVKAGRGEIIQPIFSTRKITTNVSILDGQTVVLGGLRKEGEIDENGKPLEPRQLLVFVTATTLAPAEAKPEPVVIIESTITEHRPDGPVIIARPKVVAALGTRSVLTIGDEKSPAKIEAMFLARRESADVVEVEATLTRTAASGKKDQLVTPKLKVKFGQPAGLRIGELEIGLTVTPAK